MARLSKKSCRPEAPAAAGELARRVALRRKPADQRLRRFRFFSCFRVSPKPVDKFLAERAKRPRPERLTARSGREPQDRCRIRRTGPEGNFPPRKALKSLETELESRKPRRRDERT